MPNIRDQSTVEAIAREFCTNGRSKLEALKKVGYKPSYYNTLGIGKVYSNIRVIEAIARIDAKNARKCEHNRLIAIKELRYSIELYDKIIIEGIDGKKLGLAYVQAIKGRNEAIKELNAISNLHSNTVHTAIDKPAELTESEQKEALEASNRVLNVKLG